MKRLLLFALLLLPSRAFGEDYWFEVGGFAKSTATGGSLPDTQWVQISRAGSQSIKFAEFNMTGNTALGYAADLNACRGWTDGTREVVLAVADKDAAGTTGNWTKTLYGSTILEIDTGGTVQAQASVEFVGDSMRVIWTTNTANANLINWWARGGDSVTCRVDTFTVASQSTDTITGVGFQPDFMMLMGGQSTGNQFVQSGAHGHLNYGMTDGSADFMTSISMEDNVSISDTYRYSSGSFLFCSLDDGTGTRQTVMDFSNWYSDGLIVSKLIDGGNDGIAYAAFSDTKWAVGNNTSPTSTGDQDWGGLGFRPNGVLLFSIDTLAAASAQKHARVSIGAADGTTNEWSVWVGSGDGGLSAVTDQASVDSIINFVNSTSPSAPSESGNLTVLDRDTASVTFTIVTSVTTTYGHAICGGEGRYNLSTKTGIANNDSVWTYARSIRDSLDVSSGDSLVMNGDLDTKVLYVSQGGRFDMDSGNAYILTVENLSLGDQASTFESFFGGNFYAWGGDTITISNTNVLGADDFNFRGSACNVYLKGTSAGDRVVVQGASGSSRPHIYDNQANGYFEAVWAKFLRLGSATATPGLTLDGNRGNTLQKIENCIFDSCGIYFNGDGENFKNDSFYTYNGYYTPIYFGTSSSDDTVQSCYIKCDNQNSTTSDGPNGVSTSGTRSMAILSNDFIGINYDAGSGHGPAIGIYTGSGDLMEIDGNYVTGWVWGFQASTGDSGRVTNNTFYNNGHISISFLPAGSDAPVGWRVAGNYAFDAFLGYPLNTFYGNNSIGNQDADLVVAFNTFVGGAAGYPWHFGDGGTGNYHYTGVVLVGNINADAAADWRIKTSDSITLASSGWSSNYFDSLLVEGSWDTTTNSTGGTNVSGNTPDFVDSANNDLRLNSTSALLGQVQTAADTAWCDSFFTSPNYNIGAYQGTGEGAASSPTLNRRRKLLMGYSKPEYEDSDNYRTPYFELLANGEIGVPGDVTNDDEVTSADIIAQVNYVLRGADPPYSDSAFQVYHWDTEVTADDRLIHGDYGAVFLEVKE